MNMNSGDNWLDDVIKNIDQPDWLDENLNHVISHLHYYLSKQVYVTKASFILSQCNEIMMGQGRYTELVQLYTIAIKTIDQLGEFGLNDYYQLKLNLAHALMMLHQMDDAIDLLSSIQEIISELNYPLQLTAYYLFLKLKSYGYQLDEQEDIVKAIKRLAIKKIPQLRLDAEIAVAYAHYSDGKIPEMKKTLTDINRLIGKYRPQPSEISRITSEPYFYLAVMHRELQQHDEAFKILDIAAQQYAEVNNHIQNMLILNETALLYGESEQAEKAIQWSDLAYQEFHLLPEQQEYHRALLDHSRGVIHFNMGQWEEALPLFQSGLKIWKKYKHEYHTALATNAIGVSYSRMQRPEEALTYLEVAKTLCCDMEDKAYINQLKQLIDDNIKDANAQL